MWLPQEGLIMGNGCAPSAETMQNLFSVAQSGGTIPDVALDRSLAGYLSLNSGTVLTNQYEAIQQRLSTDQLALFNQNLTSTFGGTRVTLGKTGVVALALSLFLDVVSNDIMGQSTPDPVRRILGVSRSSIGSIISEYLRKVPEVVNNSEGMADITDLCDQELKFELIDLFERMTLRRQLSSRALKLWLNGAAIHLHVRIHGIRLGSVPQGSAESLRLSYSTAYSSLIRRYTGYLRRYIKETPPSDRTHSTGLLVIEPNRNVSHWVKHSPCESQAIENSFLTQIIAAQRIQSTEDYLEDLGKNLNLLVRHSNNFELTKKEV
ncbi:hypothetical protein ACEWY4_014430 [Coilia grayii]|uniref:Uncharacterized protein n=1 Tax=Coilia grayii TaxID=363190 RepID=A0ABD1JS96_9TELE